MNLLKLETSPYLLQHKDNPVHWKPWSEDAFQDALRRDVPVILSIGYSTCHWCHVMEHESFMDQDTADIMNSYFVCIKVDREERPDIDDIYMKACQILTGSGGWPLNCFLLPDKRPFFAGTYFPPDSHYGRPSWNTVLKNISIAYQSKKDTLLDQADQLTKLIQKNELVAIETDPLKDIGEKRTDLYKEAYQKLAADFDGKHGGFGGAPKFPQPFRLQFLLIYHLIYGHSVALEHVCHTLDQMIAGGLYDHVHGGFARYTVDRAWHIPHFEKMLYDNAFLVKILARTYKATKSVRYKNILNKTISFIHDHLAHPEGGYMAAIDADSEGIEGLYYLWTSEFIDQLSASTAKEINDFFSVKAEGNWEGYNILYFRHVDKMKSYYDDTNIEAHPLTIALNSLKTEATQKAHPSIDFKRICSWNAWWGTALCEAFRAVPDQRLLSMAQDLYASMKKDFIRNEQLIHVPGYPHDVEAGFAEDYTAWIGFLLDLYQVTFDSEYMKEAAQWMERARELFTQSESPLLYTNKVNIDHQIANLVQVYDSATPSTNSEFLEANARMYLYTHEEKYLQTYLSVSNVLSGIMKKFPQSITLGLSAGVNFDHRNEIICITGPMAISYANELLSKVSNETAIVIITNDAKAKMLNITTSTEKTLIYRCKNFVCSLPYDQTEAFLSDYS